jgi:hypothetical protein
MINMIAPEWEVRFTRKENKWKGYAERPYIIVKSGKERKDTQMCTTLLYDTIEDAQIELLEHIALLSKY